jgi:hypothetical protein
VILALIQVLSLAPSPAPLPEPLVRYLEAHPTYRLLTPADLARERDYIEGHHLFSPTASADVTGDGIEDVLAVLVRRDGAKTLYAVAAFHGARDPSASRLFWVVKETAEPILGVAASTNTRRIDILKCYQCSSNPFYRWNGTEYQWTLRARGEASPVYHGATGAAEVRAGPSSSAKVVATVPPCAQGEILSVFPKGGHVAWYEIAIVLKDKRIVGFVPVEDLDEMPCMGR